MPEQMINDKIKYIAQNESYILSNYCMKNLLFT